jgi:hypothetical protein
MEVVQNLVQILGRPRVRSILLCAHSQSMDCSWAKGVGMYRFVWWELEATRPTVPWYELFLLKPTKSLSVHESILSFVLLRNYLNRKLKLFLELLDVIVTVATFSESLSSDAVKLLNTTCSGGLHKSLKDCFAFFSDLLRQRIGFTLFKVFHKKHLLVLG